MDPLGRYGDSTLWFGTQICRRFYGRGKEEKGALFFFPCGWDLSVYEGFALQAKYLGTFRHPCPPPMYLVSPTCSLGSRRGLAVIGALERCISLPTSPQKADLAIPRPPSCRVTPARDGFGTSLRAQSDVPTVPVGQGAAC
jgi:hypothetical protein